MLPTINMVHGSEKRLYPTLQVIGKAWYPRQSSLDQMGKGPLHLG